MKGFKARDVEELKKMTETELEHYKDKARREIYDGAFREPLEWFQHDSNTHKDKDIQDLIVILGAEGYGQFWLLMEELACDPDHYINVSRPCGWQQVINATHCKDKDQAEKLVCTLANLGLIDSNQFADGIIVNERMESQVYKAHSKLAQGRYGTFCRDLKRQIDSN